MQGSGIEGRAVTVRKAATIILHELDFAVEPGKITGIIGPSGSGKTTLMRAIIGVQTLTSGALTVLGQLAGSKVLRSKIGYVAQAPAVYEDLTVRQNLAYFAALVGASNAQVDEILAKVHLDGRAQQIVGKLSGGERARVSLAVALLGKPEVLVLDEPTVGLDPLLRQELWQLFRELADEGRTLLISSHVMEEAEKCDSLLLLRDGSLLWRDSRRQLLEETETQSVEDAFLQMVRGGEV